MKSYVIRFWFFAAMPLVALILALFSAFLLYSKVVDSEEISKLKDQKVSTEYQLYISRAENQRLHNELSKANTALNDALIPQATVGAAFKEQIATPIANTTSKAWTAVKSSSIDIWNLFFE